MAKVTLQARMPGERKWKTRNTFAYAAEGQMDAVVAQAAQMMSTWRNYRDGAEMRVHVE
jgi:hypothetical protein